MNLKHDLETPVNSLKMIFSILREEGLLNDRIEKNIKASFSRIKNILEEIPLEIEDKNFNLKDSKESLGSNLN